MCVMNLSSPDYNYCWKFMNSFLIVLKLCIRKQTIIYHQLTFYTCDNHVVVNKYHFVRSVVFLRLLFSRRFCRPTATREKSRRRKIDTENDTLICLWSWNVSLLFGCCLRKPTTKTTMMMPEKCFFIIHSNVCRVERKKTKKLSDGSISSCARNASANTLGWAGGDVDKSRQ